MQDKLQARKYTAVYVYTWTSCYHMQSLTKIATLERQGDETVIEMLDRAGVLESTVFLFNGWPSLTGEGSGE